MPKATPGGCTSPNRPLKRRIKNIDPLRGFLALVVLLYHLPLVSKTVGLPYFGDAPIFHRGYHAVAVFFCLSGYLIIGLLFDEKRKNGTINVRDFYIRRILRIYPVYYLVLIFGFLFYHVLLPIFKVPFEVNYDLGKGLLLCIGFLPNVFTKLYDPGSILSVLWSIGVEEQFYLLIAPALFILPLHRFVKYLLAFSAIYFILFHLSFFSVLMKFGFLYFFMSVGGLMAVLERQGHQVYFGSFALRLLVYAIFLLHFTTDWFQFQDAMVQNLFEVLLFNLTLVNLANDQRWTIKAKFANYLGKVSYGIYMYHMIVINLVLYLFLQIQRNMVLEKWSTVVLINGISMALTFWVAHLSYTYLELYFLRLKKRFRK